jgi:hypothetical protein
MGGNIKIAGSRSLGSRQTVSDRGSRSRRSEKGEVVLRIFLSSSRQNSISDYEPEHC